MSAHATACGAGDARLPISADVKNYLPGQRLSMSIRVALNHKTEYHYDRPVTLPAGRPAAAGPALPDADPELLAASRAPRPLLNWQQDPYSNYLARLVFPKPTEEFTVEVDLVAEMTVINPFDFFIEEAAEKYPFGYEPALARELIPYLETEPAGPRLRPWPGASPPRHPHRRLPGRDQPVGCTRRSATSSGWSRESSPARRRSTWAAGPAATRAGCWSRSSGTWAWRPGSCRDT